MFKRWILFGVLTLSLLSPFDSSRVLAAPITEFREADCMFTLPVGVEQGRDVICGYLTVPSNYAQANGSTFDLAVVIIKSHEPVAQPDPIVILQGGPGGSVISSYAAILTGENRILKDRDLILLEQRGTPYSRPALYCEEYERFVLDYLNIDLSLEDSDRLSTEAFLACLRRAQADGIDLDDFDSFENARDIESLRVALGFDKINLYGVSYGSLLAQHYMRLFPESLRSVILDGVVAPQLNINTDYIQNEDRAFRYFFEACKNDEQCNRYFPDLETVFYEVVKKLDEKPVHLQLRDLEGGGTYPAILDGQSLYGSVFQMLYAADIVFALPRMIYQAREGEFGLFSVISSFFVFDKSMSYGMYFAVNCAEDSDFRLEDVKRDGIDPRVGEFNRNGPDSFLEICRIIDVPQLGPQADESIQSDVPTLLLSGGFDPVTPETNAQAAAVNLKNSHLFFFPSGAHGQLLDNECTDSLAVQFWNDPTKSPDAGCIAEVTKPEFYTRENRLSIPLLARIFALDTNLLLEAGLFALSLLGLLSAFFAFPLLWLIGRSARRPQPVLPDTLDIDNESPSVFVHLATPLTLLNGLVLTAFSAAFVVLFFVEVAYDAERLLFGFPGNTWPFFTLPGISALLTLGMILAIVSGWRFPDWSVWRKIYLTLMLLCAIVCVAVLVYWRLFGVLFYR